MFLFLWIFLLTDIQAAAVSANARCPGEFRTVSLSEVKRVFSDKTSYEIYQGQKGYLLFVSQGLNVSEMRYAFRIVSKALKGRFKELGWQSYQGTTDDFYKERGRILNSDGRSVKEEYRGMLGYAKYAEEHHDKAMQKAFKNVSAVLDSAVFKELDWQQYQGTSDDFYKERGRILNSDGSVKEEYRGMSGYAQYAEDYHNKAMKKAFQNVSAVLDSAVFKELGWQIGRAHV